jgi:hypothetical protein
MAQGLPAPAPLTLGRRMESDGRAHESPEQRQPRAALAETLATLSRPVLCSARGGCRGGSLAGAPPATATRAAGAVHHAVALPSISFLSLPLPSILLWYQSKEEEIAGAPLAPVASDGDARHRCGSAASPLPPKGIFSFRPWRKGAPPLPYSSSCTSACRCAQVREERHGRRRRRSFAGELKASTGEFFSPSITFRLGFLGC